MPRSSVQGGTFAAEPLGLRECSFMGWKSVSLLLSMAPIPAFLPVRNTSPPLLSAAFAERGIKGKQR